MAECWWREEESGSGSLKMVSQDEKCAANLKGESNAALQVLLITLFFIYITQGEEEWMLDATPTVLSSSLIHFSSVC